MADGPNDKTPDAIKKHRPQQTLEMKGPMGSSIRQSMANQRASKDYERLNSDRASKYANIEKQKIANKENVREGTRGKLSQEINKQVNKERER